jgi:hypothetical protein
VYAALAYYVDHRDDIDRRIADDPALARAHAVLDLQQAPLAAWRGLKLL